MLSWLSLSTKPKLYNIRILPVMLYGLECWALSRVDARKVDALDHWCLRRILDISWYHSICNCEVRRLTEQPPLTTIIQERRLMLFGHLVRMDESADTRRIPTAVPQSDWRRPVGRPYTSWMATLKNDLSLHNLTLEDAIELALEWISRCGDYWQQAELRTDGACRIMMMMICLKCRCLCVSWWLSCLLQYEMDEEKVANLLQIPIYFDLEIYVASRQEKVSCLLCPVNWSLVMSVMTNVIPCQLCCSALCCCFMCLSVLSLTTGNSV